MTDIRKIWIFGLISGIITIIALMTPTARFRFSTIDIEYYEIQWMWGLLYYNLKDWYYYEFISGFEFITHAREVFILGLITSITLLTCAILSIVSSGMYRKHQQFSYIKKFWIISGVLQIASGIGYIVGMEIGFNIYRIRTLGQPVSFWENRIPNFGVIAPIVSGILCIIGVVVGRKFSRRGDVIVPLEQIRKPRINPMTQWTSEPHLNQTVEISTFNYCPECGHKIQVTNSKYCTHCGISLVGK